MWQGRKFMALCTALALCTVAGFSTTATTPAVAAAKPAKAAKARNAMHQFTGYVTALDKSSLTVEKRGKKARTVVFTKHAEMKTTGDLEKDARVTVYYRDEGGRSVAHKVVVKSESSTSSGG